MPTRIWSRISGTFGATATGLDQRSSTGEKRGDLRLVEVPVFAARLAAQASGLNHAAHPNNHRPKRRKPAAAGGGGANTAAAAAAAAATSKEQAALKPQRSAAAAAAAARSLAAAALGPHSQDAHALIKRRVRVVDPDAVVQIKVPAPPLPVAWGRAVRPFRAPVHFQLQQVVVPTSARSMQQQQRQQARCDDGSGSLQCGEEGDERAQSSSYHSAPDLCAFDFRQLPQQEFLAVLINTGWEKQPGEAVAGSGGPAISAAAHGGAQPTGGTTIQQSRAQLVRRLAVLPVPRLCPRGFVFAWAPKQLLSAVVSQLQQWGFCYVENLTWVWTRPNNGAARLPHAFTASSHLTLLIFRREGDLGGYGRGDWKRLWDPPAHSPPLHCVSNLAVPQSTNGRGGPRH
jgi:hypothetical protein